MTGGSTVLGCPHVNVILQLSPYVIDGRKSVLCQHL
jgi:hypothetical protein